MSIEIFLIGYACIAYFTAVALTTVVLIVEDETEIDGFFVTLLLSAIWPMTLILLGVLIPAYCFSKAIGKTKETK
jgi:hypothetical protein